MKVTRHVLFKSSAFNTTEPRDYFLNECCFGDDVARWFIRELRKLGYQADEEPGQEDFGWYIYFRAGDMDFCLLIAYRPGVDDEKEGDWICTLERRTGVNAISFFFGAPKRGIKNEGPRAIHAVLSTSPLIQDIRWFTDRDIDDETNAKPEPVLV